MPRIIETTVYSLDELSDAAKDKARSWFRENLIWDWWDGVYEDFAEICSILGIDLATLRVRLMGGGTRQDIRVYFSVFSSQGAGACFEGTYRFAKDSQKRIREHAPQDEKLHRIADELARLQARSFYQLSAKITHRGRYCHAFCMDIDVSRDSPSCQPMTDDAEQGAIEFMRDLANWLYRQLEAEYDCQTSDENVDAGIQANEYTFTAEGRRFG